MRSINHCTICPTSHINKAPLPPPGKEECVCVCVCVKNEKLKMDKVKKTFHFWSWRCKKEGGRLEKILAKFLFFCEWGRWEKSFFGRGKEGGGGRGEDHKSWAERRVKIPWFFLGMAIYSWRKRQPDTDKIIISSQKVKGLLIQFLVKHAKEKGKKETWRPFRGKFPVF